MNQYPWWKYLILLFFVIVGVVYTIPNLYGEDYAVQISLKEGAKINDDVVSQVKDVLAQQNLKYLDVSKTENQVLVRFPDTDTQLKANDVTPFRPNHIALLVIALINNASKKDDDLDAPKVLPLIIRSHQHLLKSYPQCKKLESEGSELLCQSIADLIKFVRKNPASEFTTDVLKAEKILITLFLKIKQQDNDTKSTVEQNRPDI